jgi:nucleoid DNA-binding protein
LTLVIAPFTVDSLFTTGSGSHITLENATVTKKDIVRQIADRIEETQLKTKEIVQLTFNAIVDTLIGVRRIELRNFGVFEVKLRKARKARNPRTNANVNVPPKFVVTFKPGKEMEERVRDLIPTPEELAELEKKKTPAAAASAADQTASHTPAPAPSASTDTNGAAEADEDNKPKKKKPKKATQA